MVMVMVMAMAMQSENSGCNAMQCHAMAVV